ncbi:MAG: hypothetical protein NC923_07405, partial [Candidatus Omnitrophica bacterium]|nr:hypothetical protein [Candidatus Omnitrophota bacterium]
MSSQPHNRKVQGDTWQKIKTKIENLLKLVASKKTRLNNPAFLKKAPPEIVEKEKNDLAAFKEELKRLERMSRELC